MKNLRKNPLFNTIILLALLLGLFANTGEQTVQAYGVDDEIHSAIISGIEYIRANLNEDGGIRWFDENANMAATIRTVFVLSTAGFTQDYLISDIGNSPIDYVLDSGISWIYQADTDQPSLNLARAGQLLTAVAVANENPHKIGPESVDLVYLIKSNYDPNAGVFGNATPDNVTDQIWAILGLASSYASVPPESVAWLENAQLEDGSWNDGFGSYLDTTPLALMALIASGHRSTDSIAVLNAVEFLSDNQQSNGGWQTDWDSTTNANTTGMMIQAIYTIGQEPTHTNWQTEEGSPLSALLELQNEEGAIGGDFTNTFSTADALLGLSARPLFQTGRVRQVGRAFEYLINVQSEDGGWGTIGQTIDIILAAQAAGWDPNTFSRFPNSPLDFLKSDLESYLMNGPDAIGKLILAAISAGGNPSDFNGIDLVSALEETFDPGNAAFGDPENTWHQSLAILGSYAAGLEISEAAVQTLVDLQQADGGWEYSSGFGSWPDNTALAIQSLLAAGFTESDPSIQSGLEYLRMQQGTDGGWDDSSTTAYVITALNALGIPPGDWAVETGKDPIDNLLTYQTPSGAFMFSPDFPDDNLMSTASALLATMGGDFLIYPTGITETNAAGLVVVPDEGEITTTCVPFEGQSISGLDLLEESGLPYSAQDGFMNAILDISNPSGGTMYWSYWRWDGREWVFNNTGAGESVVEPGGVEAWFFTSWEVFPSMPPNTVPVLYEICQANILKSYSAQPYVNFYDLQRSEISFLEPLPIAGDETMPADQDMDQETGVTDPTDTPSQRINIPVVSTDNDQTESTLPILPILLIGVVGVAAVGTIMLVILKKNK